MGEPASKPAVTSRAGAAGGAPFVVARHGSFFVGGRGLGAPDSYDPTLSSAGSGPGQHLWADQMHVQWQIPENPRQYPLMLVHGGSGTGRVWETTRDRREGYQTRRPRPVRLALACTIAILRLSGNGLS